MSVPQTRADPHSNQILELQPAISLPILVSVIHLQAPLTLPTQKNVHKMHSVNCSDYSKQPQHQQETHNSHFFKHCTFPRQNILWNTKKKLIFRS